jgi:hypothetical protein
MYSDSWNAEIAACRAIALHVDLERLGFLSILRSFVFAKLGVLSVQTAKRMSFVAALRREQQASFGFKLALVALISGLAFWRLFR